MAAATLETKKVSIILDVRTVEKLVYHQTRQRFKSFSSFAAKLIEEALDKYDDPDQLALPLVKRR
jgi:hypothetical protein